MSKPSTLLVEFVNGGPDDGLYDHVPLKDGELPKYIHTTKADGIDYWYVLSTRVKEHCPSIPQYMYAPVAPGDFLCQA